MWRVSHPNKQQQIKSTVLIKLLVHSDNLTNEQRTRVCSAFCPKFNNFSWRHCCQSWVIRPGGNDLCEEKFFASLHHQLKKISRWSILSLCEAEQALCLWALLNFFLRGRPQQKHWTDNGRVKTQYSYMRCSQREAAQSESEGIQQIFGSYFQRDHEAFHCVHWLKAARQKEEKKRLWILSSFWCLKSDSVYFFNVEILGCECSRDHTSGHLFIPIQL